MTTTKTMPTAVDDLVEALRHVGIEAEVERGEEPITITYHDGSERAVMCDTVGVTGIDGRALVVARWAVNPDSGRWKQLGVRFVLMTGSDYEDRIAEAAGLMPRHVYWEPSLRRALEWLNGPMFLAGVDSTLIRWNES